jgi:hypothetical protein
VDAAFMQLKQHERGIHAVWSGTGGVEVAKVRLSSGQAPASAASGPERRFRGA